MPNALHYGDNLDVLRLKIAAESVDLCYIDPPFNSKRNYFQIYNIGHEDRAQTPAFVDTWAWDALAESGLDEISSNVEGRFTTRSADLLRGLAPVLGQSSLLAYLVSITLRAAEIHRVLKPTGSFYFHCDPSASHYIKLVLDSIFLAEGGSFRNEIIWAYESGGRSAKDFGRKHDVILRYAKSDREWLFNLGSVLLPRATTRSNHMKKSVDEDGRAYWSIKSAGKVYKYFEDEGVIPSDVWGEFGHLQQKDPERLGYPTQKPEALLERIVAASSNEGDVVLDAYCGGGTTIAVAHKMKRRWIGIDITYQSISLMLRRIEKSFGTQALSPANLTLDGVPRDMASAHALAHKADDRLHLEFEKWAVLTYSNNRAIVRASKGAGQGMDGVAYTATGASTADKVILQVKSGGVQRLDIAALRGDMAREGAPLGVFITLEEPSKTMRAEASAAGVYRHPMMGRNYPSIQIVTVREIVEGGQQLDLPLALEVVKSAGAHSKYLQSALPVEEAEADDPSAS